MRRDRRLTGTWLALVLLTAAGMGASQAPLAPAILNIAVLLGAALKGWWIAVDFLELRSAPRGFRAVSAVWLAVIVAAVYAGAAIAGFRG